MMFYREAALKKEKASLEGVEKKIMEFKEAQKKARQSKAVMAQKKKENQSIKNNPSNVDQRLTYKVGLNDTTTRETLGRKSVKKNDLSLDIQLKLTKQKISVTNSEGDTTATPAVSHKLNQSNKK